MIIKLLARIGIVRIRRSGGVRWPIHIAPWWIWKTAIMHPIGMFKFHGGIYVFRNLPGVIKWEKDRWLPRRWGFGIMGLIEFGDRG